METPEATKRQAAFLATFQCHKRVQAGRIIALDLHPGQMWVKVEAKPPEQSVVFPVDATMLARFDPYPGDYAVVYDGGYLSFSPREVFEDGYKRWPDPSLPSAAEATYRADAELSPATEYHDTIRARYVPGDEAAHKPLPVAGYKPQDASTVALVNINKRTEEAVLRILDDLAACPEVDKRWLAIGRTQLEQAFMAINRAIFKPERVKL